jgi:hypothetical protein
MVACGGWKVEAEDIVDSASERVEWAGEFRYDEPEDFPKDDDGEQDDDEEEFADGFYDGDGVWVHESRSLLRGCGFRLDGVSWWEVR